MSKECIHFFGPLCILRCTVSKISKFQSPVQELKCVSAGANSQHGIHGPVFLLEPPPVLRFSNATGSQVSCSAHGSPPPDVTWLHHDGSVVTAVPGFRWVHVHIILTFRVVVRILCWTFLIGWYGTLCDVSGRGCTQSSDDLNIIVTDLIFSFDVMVTADMLPRRVLSNGLEYDIECVTFRSVILHGLDDKCSARHGYNLSSSPPLRRGLWSHLTSYATGSLSSRLISPIKPSICSYYFLDQSS